MNKIDTKRILEKTNQMIGYEKSEREEKIMEKKLKKMSYAFIATITLLGGTFTINAMTNNSIVEGIKGLFTIKVNGTENNAKCEKTQEGTLKCQIDGNTNEEEKEITVEIDENLINNAKITNNNDKTTMTSEVEITPNK